MDAGQSYLDSVRITEGPARCAEAFREAHRKYGLSAAALINDRRVSFPCLFILVPQIKALRLHKGLNSRNLIALKIIGQILGRRNAGGEDYLSVKRNRVYTVLKWMLETGYQEDGMNDDYEQIMEAVVSVLLNTYKDKSIMPTVIDMIFKRGVKGHYIHDLVWSVFKLNDPQTLRLIAQRLRSPEDRESELAGYLLNIDSIETKEEPFEYGSAAVQAQGEYTDEEDKERRYETYIRWLEENDPFLYFTEEGFQYTSNPAFSVIDYERKYLHRKNDMHTKQPLLPLNERESAALSSFRLLSEKEKALLSEYSFRKYSSNPDQWEMWIGNPIDEQLMSAKNAMNDRGNLA